MTEVARTIEIEATPDQVWTVLADFGAIASWARSVDHSCLVTEQPTGVGAARRVQVGRTVLIERVVRWEPGAVLGYELTGLPPIVKSATNTWSLVSSAGGTRVSLTTAVHCGALPPQRLLAKAVGRKLAQASDALLADLTTRMMPDHIIDSTDEDST